MVTLAAAGSIASIIGAGLALPGAIRSINALRWGTIKKVKSDLESLQNLPDVYRTLTKLTEMIEFIAKQLKPFGKRLEQFSMDIKTGKIKIDDKETVQLYTLFMNNLGNKKAAEFFTYCENNQLNGNKLININEINPLKIEFDEIDATSKDFWNLAREPKLNLNQENELRLLSFKLLEQFYAVNYQLLDTKAALSDEAQKARNGILEILNEYDIHSILEIKY